uniref:hypothetical protein n=1 Tax=Streptomyces sp. NBC_01562 TaxID=2975879 RepID=UPI002F9132E6
MPIQTRRPVPSLSHRTRWIYGQPGQHARFEHNSRPQHDGSPARPVGRHRAVHVYPQGGAVLQVDIDERPDRWREGETSRPAVLQQRLRHRRLHIQVVRAGFTDGGAAADMRHPTR